MAGVAEVTLVDGGAATEFRVEPFPGVGVIVLDGRCERRFFDADGPGQGIDGRRLDQFAAFDVALEMQGKRLDTAEPVAPEKTPIADEVE